MIDLLKSIPSDMLECEVDTMNNLGFKGWPKEHPIYSDREIVVQDVLLSDNDELNYLLREQMNKPFAIPSIIEINELCKLNYRASTQAYKKLENFFVQKLSLTYEQAVTFCGILNDIANSDESPNEYFKIIESANIIETEEQLRELVDLVMNAHNFTRMKTNRGNTPLELAKRAPRAPRPTIVPGSTNSAKMLDEAANHLKKMGVRVDLSEDIVGGKKVYPNDPCPCGSGKKYGKCCGRK